MSKVNVKAEKEAGPSSKVLIQCLRCKYYVPASRHPMGGVILPYRWQLEEGHYLCAQCASHTW